MQRSESAGVLFALAGFTCLSIGDAVVKTMAGMWPPTAIAATRYVIGAFGLSALLFVRRGPTAFRPPAPALQLMRGFGVGIATAGFFAAIFVMPLADATAITFTSPMLTGLLAALLLGEPARRETWFATIAAFCGVLIVLRPNFIELGFASLLPLLSALGMSLLVIGNRAVAGRASPLAMQVFVAVAAAPLLIAIALTGHLSGMPRLNIGAPHWSVLVRCAFVACTASFAHWLIFLGTTRAGAATVAPMTYVQLIVATLLGWLLFGDKPDAVAMFGAAIIVGAGLYLWYAARRREAVKSSMETVGAGDACWLCRRPLSNGIVCCREAGEGARLCRYTRSLPPGDPCQFQQYGIGEDRRECRGAAV